MKTKSKLTKTLLFGALGVTTLAVTIPVVVSCSSVDTKITLEHSVSPVDYVFEINTKNLPTSDKYVSINGNSGLVLKFSNGGGLLTTANY